MNFKTYILTACFASCLIQAGRNNSIDTNQTWSHLAGIFTSFFFLGSSKIGPVKNGPFTKAVGFVPSYIVGSEGFKLTMNISHTIQKNIVKIIEK